VNPNGESAAVQAALEAMDGRVPTVRKAVRAWAMVAGLDAFPRAVSVIDAGVIAAAVGGY